MKKKEKLLNMKVGRDREEGKQDKVEQQEELKEEMDQKSYKAEKTV